MRYFELYERTNSWFQSCTNGWALKASCIDELVSDLRYYHSLKKKWYRFELVEFGVCEDDATHMIAQIESDQKIYVKLNKIVVE